MKSHSNLRSAASDTLLFIGTEDYTAMYLVLWEFNSKFPKLSPEERIVLIKEALSDLIDRGWVVLHRGTADKLEKMSPLDALDVVRDYSDWNPLRDGEAGIYLETTTQGEKFNRHRNAFSKLGAQAFPYRWRIAWSVLLFIAVLTSILWRSNH